MIKNQPVAYTEIINQLEDGGTLREIRPLPGSFSNESTLISYETAVGRKQIVMRRYVVFVSYDRGEKAEREFKTLALLQQHHIPAPMPLLLDKNGDLLGSPGIVTSFVPGQQIISPTNEANWIAELAKTLARIHAIPLTATEKAFLLNGNEEVTWFLNDGRVTEQMSAYPDGTAVWHAVHDLLTTIQPVPPALTHVDHWTGNILWHNQHVSAVLDWEEASCGDPGYDVAYLRLELAMLGSEQLADAFLDAYEQANGQPVANLAFWELAAAARFMPDPEGMIPEWQALQAGAYSVTAVRQNFTDFIVSAQSRAGLKEYK